jgi:hypothetical protein
VTTIKRGDAAPLTLDLGVALTAYSTATVIVGRTGEDAYELTGTIDGQTVTATLPTTLPVGDYQVEVEMAPGPHTYPSEGYATLTIVRDLNPS